MFPLLLQSMRVTDFQKRGATALQNGSINIYKRWSATCWGAPTFSPVFIGILGSLPPRRSRVTQRERESRSIQGNHNSIVLIHFPSILLLGGNFTFFFLFSFTQKGTLHFHMWMSYHCPSVWLSIRESLSHFPPTNELSILTSIILIRRNEKGKEEETKRVDKCRRPRADTE